MRRLTCILALLAVCLCTYAQELPTCARPEDNCLLIPGEGLRIARFARRLKAVRESPDSSVTIWHIGGSHVQAGYFPSRLRTNFDSLGRYPALGRGFIFPYPLAHSNYDRSYCISYEGEWLGSRSTLPNKHLPIKPRYGVMGIAAYTADTLAAFGLGTPRPFTRLRMMAEGSEGAAPLAICGTDTLRFASDSLLKGYVAEFPGPVDSVRIEPGIADGGWFVITGLLPEDDARGGVRLVSTGVNGARTTTWLERCPEFGRESALICPDLMLLGLGINDSSCPAKDFKPEKFKANYRKLLDIILSRNPQCALVFITNNDSYRYARRRMVHNDNGPAVRKAMLELAAEYDGAVWDLFEIMGGNGSAVRWMDAGLMKKDRLHFTAEGYRLLGDMLYQALTEACDY